MGPAENAKKLRATIKIYLKFLKWLEVFVNDELASAKKSNVRLRHDELVARHQEFLKAQSALESLEEDELESDTRSNVDNLYFNLMSALDDRLDEFKSNAVVPVPKEAEDLHFLPKLPELTLDKFSGDLKKWQSFIEAFDNHVHCNNRLSDITKFQYLKNSVQGAAAKTFENLDFVSANYEEARRLLTARFDRPNLIVEDHIRSLFTMKPITKPTPANLLALLDEFNSHLRSLKTMGRPTNYWGDLVVYLIVSKFDAETKSKWRDFAPINALACFDDVSKFIQTHSFKLESQYNDSSSKTSQQPQSQKPQASTSSKPPKHTSHSFHTRTTKNYSCIHCNKSGHTIMRCLVFLSLSSSERRKIVDDLKLCLNCLRNTHTHDNCSDKNVCQICGATHHTLLHDHGTSSNPNFVPPPKSKNADVPASNTSLSSQTSSPKFVILATAIIEVIDKNGSPREARALLDSGSQLHCMTESFAVTLGIQTTSSSLNIRGIGGCNSLSSKVATICIRSKTNKFSRQIEAHILPQISDNQPSFQFNPTAWRIPSNVQLADPNFYIPGKIDILLGAELFFELMSIGQISLGNDLPTLQNTLLGWIISGYTSQTNGPTQLSSHLVNHDVSSSERTDQLLEKFWHLENVTDSTHPDENFDSECDRHFKSTHYRDESGRFVVRLPFQDHSEQLGSSSLLAEKRFYSLERKLDRHIDQRKSYNEFMSEYINLDHMEVISPEDIESPNYYLPHHCVIKPDSSSTKLRVVFDGSAKSSSGVSLNNILMSGPVVQNELFTILLRFRSHAYAISADITKMYRQIMLHEADQKYQYILWRFASSDPLQTYRLKTVTYGTTCAPYLATRCLLQLAIDSMPKCSIASAAIKDDMYVDDLLSGSNSLEGALQLKSSVTSLLDAAGMPLRKWCSNSLDVLSNIPEDDREQFLHIDDGDFVKTLGLFWQSQLDSFHIRVNPTTSTRVTKRIVISETARIFDPIGLISPVVVCGKLFMQTLWELKVDWDEGLSMDHHSKWSHFRNELLKLNQLSIPRHLFNGCSSPASIQLHGFADASERAFGAVVYVRSRFEDGYCVRLLCSKSRVAPLKKTTLPRLELCAAQLLAKLIHKIKGFLNFHIEDIFYWSDSTITLCWLRAPSSKWKTFVCNRVSDIQHHSDSTKWRHVESKLNPADLISRGSLPDSLISSKLWWNGPPFLQSADEFWAESSDDGTPTCVDATEQRKSIDAFVTSDVNADADVVLRQVAERTSFYLQIRRRMAYVSRYFYNLRHPAARIRGPLSTDDYDRGTKTMIRLIQLQSFPNLLQDLLKPNATIRDASLKSLSLFLDADKIIRVGGRLQSSTLTYCSQHPALLPSQHFLTLTLINFFHRKYLHVGPQGLLAAIRQQYWPINGRQLCKRVCRACVLCSRVRPRLLRQQMASLPADRITMSPPFYRVGVDYAGPFFITTGIRGRAPIKTYLAVFVCLTTKAVHLELASDLSTAAFLGAFRRFTSTRGSCKRVYSDNATNFVGANSQLHELFSMLQSTQLNDDIRKLFEQDAIEWSFQPPGSPHFGGLYEAAVKSCKYHLRRMMGTANLNYEELHTLIKQVEAVLNSRPLTPLPSENELDVLTPGHFLIGRPLTGIPEPNIPDDRNINLVRRWDLVDRLYKSFWSRWSKEYLQSLQHRYYWQDKTRNLPIGTIVAIQDENQPPLRWKLGRVILLHPGPDNLVRVVTLKTATGTLKRAITKLSPLPIAIEPQEVNGGENDHDQGDSSS